jgi:vacuolar protein sorting-associated protein 13A/C
LKNTSNDSLHLLERINIDLQIDKSIVPAAVNLAQFKISGNLPSLQVNFSDAKYKSLMRLVDVCIPHFDDAHSSSETKRTVSGGYQLAGGLFGQAEPEYNVDDHDEDDNEGALTPREDLFFEAEHDSMEVAVRSFMTGIPLTDGVAARNEATFI